MNRLIALAAFALALVASPAAAEERLVSPPLEGFVVAHQQANSTQSIREEIPAGETLEQWTRMVTTQRFGNLAHVDPVDFAEGIAGNAPKSCPGAEVTEIQSLEHDGHPAAIFAMFCPAAPGHGGVETVGLLIVQGEEALHVKQYAFRYMPREGDIPMAIEFLRATRVVND